MSKFVKQLHSDIDVQQLKHELLPLIEQQYPDENQLCLFSQDGNDDWLTGAKSLDCAAERFATINESLRGTYTEQVLSRYKKYFRWRICVLDKRKPSYSVHRDVRGNTSRNFRIHIPIVSGLHSRMVFFPSHIKDPDQYEVPALMYQFSPGNSYLVNTTQLHTAVNFFPDFNRIHIVGEVNYGRQ